MDVNYFEPLDIASFNVYPQTPQDHAVYFLRRYHPTIIFDKKFISKRSRMNRGNTPNDSSEPRGNCNPHLANVHFETGRLQMGNFETTRFQCSELQRLD